MGEVLERTDLESAIAQLHHALDLLSTADPDYLSDEQSISVMRDFERARRRMDSTDHALIMNVESRGIPARSGLRNTAHWLRDALTVDIHEANARVRAAHATGPRRSLLGEPLAPTYPVVAAAQAAGGVAAKQARVITAMLDKLPPAACEQIPAVEARLVGFAATLDAGQLAQCAERERAYLDPDGGYRDVEHRRRARELQATFRPDGSCSGSFQGTAEFGEFLQVIFDTFAAPTPESNGVKDLRTTGQRRHDGVLDGLKAAVNAGTLPTTGGVLATVVLTMTEQAYKTGTGFATTGHRAQVPVREAMSWAGGDYRLFTTVLNSLHEVTAYSTCHRFYTENQRLALIARDGGCAFPSCTAPPGWTQAHHITEWQDTHRTSVDDGCLLCGYHHREFERLGWRVIMTNGRPTWIPPRFIDPNQTPIPT